MRGDDDVARKAIVPGGHPSELQRHCHGGDGAIGIDFPYPNFTGPATFMGLLLARAVHCEKDAPTPEGPLVADCRPFN